MAVRGKEERTAGGSKRGSSPHKKRGSNTHTELRTTTTDTTAAYLFTTPNYTQWYASSLPLPQTKNEATVSLSLSFFVSSLFLSISLFPFWLLHPSSTLSVHHFHQKGELK